MKKIYISGPITGRASLNVDAFSEAENEITKQRAQPVNPHVICQHINPRDYKTELDLWLAYMRVCLPAVKDCDAIILLPGWETSRGARKELTTAINYELEVTTWEQYRDRTAFLEHSEREISHNLANLTPPTRKRIADHLKDADIALKEAQREYNEGMRDACKAYHGFPLPLVWGSKYLTESVSQLRILASRAN